MKKEIRKDTTQKGITLISLVITIIVMLILAGVAINALSGDGGIFDMATRAVEQTEKVTEEEALQEKMLEIQMELVLGSEESVNRIGEPLYNRTMQNNANWHIIKVGEETYGNGWYYIEKGKEAGDLGIAKNNFLINYNTGEIIYLEEGKFISLSAGDALAVKDSLILNLDSSIVDKNVTNDKKSLEAQLGEGVTLVNFDYDDNSGLTSTSFNFDGVNDYIKIQYDKEEQKKTLAENGFTFEFYGKWDGGTTDPRVDWQYKGLFCYWNGYEQMFPAFRFGLGEDIKQLVWNAASDKSYSDYGSGDTDPWNIRYSLEQLDELRKREFYLTVTLDTSNAYSATGIYKELSPEISKEGEFYKQKVYLDGKLVYEGDYNKQQWDNFVKTALPSLTTFCVGRSGMSVGGAWNYSKMQAKSLRLYSRALSDSEVKENYEKSIAYHQ